ncbi:DUF4153 domain-containing protein [Mycolicibacterium arenosum]|uniref:DUF4173 domain-containing protein n=1 Tax=Mycolicibacterium arenosum TaxID=2952157 RepID=A0ABT1M8L6_9MYCO|nr:DUF4173 domain-containing protein [Mycolicibacterium sp. CAU 1645]MCP9275529.1 DUF4173 domain-containing protein [Mycolicibacterium sp. CAU 1645]
MTMPGQGWYATPVSSPVLPPPQMPPVQGPLPPRHGEPGWSIWPRKVWPLDPTEAAPQRAVVLAVVAGLIGTAVWRIGTLSIGYLVVGVLVFGVVFGTAQRRPSRDEWLGMAITLALLAVPAILAATWLGVLCVLAAWLVGWGTLVGGRTWTAVFVGPFIAWLAPARVAGWVQRAVPGSGIGDLGRGRVLRAGVVVAVTVVLALVFGGLFASADPAFSRVLDGLTPEWSFGQLFARVVVFGVVVAFVLIGAYLVRFAPRLDAAAPPPMRPVPNWEWAFPLGVLNVLFLGFVAVQATVLFGGHEHVLGTDGLTYAEYARQGFWQLLWVAALTLVVLAVVIRVAARVEPRDRVLLRVLVGTLCATSIVVVISAIHRMWVYQQAYGFSVQRLVVITIELWLGAVFLLIAITGIRMAGRWLPRAVLLAGVVALLGLAAMNPERFIAERNIDRYEQSGLLDTEYLLRLSPDIQPALQRLPEAMRVCAFYRDDRPVPWYAFNLARARANHDGTPDDACSEYWESSR